MSQSPRTFKRTLAPTHVYGIMIYIHGGPGFKNSNKNEKEFILEGSVKQLLKNISIISS